MSNERLGCYSCFKTLDPQDKQERWRTFIKCTECDAIYHERCLRKGQKCFRCGNYQTELTEMAPPPPLEVENRPVAVKIIPSEIAYSSGTIGFVVPNSLESFHEYAYEKIELLLLSAVSSSDTPFANNVRENINALVPMMGLMLTIILMLLIFGGCNIIF